MIASILSYPSASFCHLRSFLLPHLSFVLSFSVVFISQGLYATPCLIITVNKTLPHNGIVQVTLHFSYSKLALMPSLYNVWLP